MASFIYNNAREAFLNADIDLTADTIKLALVTASYTPNQDTHDMWDDVSANEVSSSGYSAGGATLASKARLCGADGYLLKMWRGRR